MIMGYVYSTACKQALDLRNIQHFNLLMSLEEPVCLRGVLAIFI